VARNSRRDKVRRLAGAIHCLPIPTPFLVGRVNCYLLEDDPLTLLDTGPNSGKALDELEQQLAALGHRVEDLERIVISHQHIDHLGLAGILKRRSGAEVCALDVLAPVVGDFRAHAEHDDELAEALMLRHGIPRDVVSALRSVSQAYRAWGGTVEVDTPLADGGTLGFAGRSLRVHHRPGHSPSDTVFHDEADGTLLGADHLLERISSVPLISLPLGGRMPVGDGRPRALLTYLESLAATREMELSRVLTGHGDPVEDHRALIDSRLALHERRARKIARLIGEEPRTAYAVAQAMWGNVAVTQAFLTLSEVLGHVDLLAGRGEVVERERGGVIVLEPA
jgi:glyoxylase-like metal-dependent hydrolase (beta-lactamase superfamily II)